MLTVIPSGARTVAMFRPIELPHISNYHTQASRSRNSRQSTFRSCIMASIQTTSSTRNTTHENDSPPALRTHSLHSSLGNDKLASGIDFHNVIPVLFLNILDMSNATANASVCNQHRYRLVFLGDGRSAQYGCDKVARGFSVGKIGLGSDE